MLLWYPDYCSGGQCVIEVEQAQTAHRSFLSLCAHHKNLRDVQGLTEALVFLAIRRSGQAKEAARWALKQDLMARGIVDKEYPGLPYTVETNGEITIRPSRDASLPGQAIPANQRARLRQLVTTESEKVERVPGISRVSLE